MRTHGLAAQFAATSTEVPSLADENAGSTISKVMAKPDLELGIEALHRVGLHPIFPRVPFGNPRRQSFAAEY
jgi:hypothetical protein